MLFPDIFVPQINVPAIDGAFAGAYAESKAPVVAAAIVKDGHTVWMKAAGVTDTAKKTPATIHTVFRIASLTKAFTATLVLQLVNEKKIGLDDAIGKTLPTLPQAWQGVTVRQLLNHTSGIPSYTNLPDFESKIGIAQTPVQLVAQTTDKPLDFPIGTQFKYDNTGYVILGMLVEKLDRRSFGKALERRILSPLGMRETQFDLGKAKGVTDGTTNDGKPALFIHMSQPFSAGSIVSSIGDMAKWVAAQGSERLLPKALWQEVWTPGKFPDGKPMRYGFGWQAGDQNGVPTLEHSGGIPGFHTFIRRVPSLNVSVVVLTNSDACEPTEVAAQLLAIVDPSLRFSDVAIDDPDPAVTRTTEKLLEGLAKGEADKSLLNAAMAERLSPEVQGQMKEFMSDLGALHELRLVKIKDGWRTYLARFEKKSVRVMAAADASGKLSGFRLTPL